MKKMLYMLSLLLVCQACKHVEAPDTSRQWEGKPRVIVMTDGEVDRPQTIHVLLEAYDMALPRMTSYARFIVTVLPE